MSDRKNIYYWKCDRSSAFHSLHKNEEEKKANGKIEALVSELLFQKFGSDSFEVIPNGAQGNHLTYRALFQQNTYFIRIENGPERDGYMMVEGRVIDEVRKTGVPVPRIFYSDSSRQEFDFAYQIMEYLPYPDLNTLYKEKQLDIIPVAYEIGKMIASWQSVRLPGYGPFDTVILKNEGRLAGYHEKYSNYYFLNLTTHLQFLVDNKFLTDKEAALLIDVVESNRKYLCLDEGCLVHKDLALWNILGDPAEVKAVIDWDDTISGDPTDDLSLLACFYDRVVVMAAVNGYQSVMELPENFYPRFYLHLLRNMIVKAVIRVGANYFNKKDDFFLIDSGSEGKTLEQVTREKIFHAYQMLNKKTENIFYE